MSQVVLNNNIRPFMTSSHPRKSPRLPSYLPLIACSRPREYNSTSRITVTDCIRRANRLMRHAQPEEFPGILHYTPFYGSQQSDFHCLTERTPRRDSNPERLGVLFG